MEKYRSCSISAFQAVIQLPCFMMKAVTWPMTILADWCELSSETKPIALIRLAASG